MTSPIHYSILDPSRNITALIESKVEISKQPLLASEIMRRHPEVEQVGFVRFDGQMPELRMAGGEFCGNASVCAAALFFLRNQDLFAGKNEMSDFPLRVSGTSQPVLINIRRNETDIFDAEIQMPPAAEIYERSFVFNQKKESLPLVKMPGISHVIIAAGSDFFCLKDHPEEAEQAIREWCEALKADGLGLMFLENDGKTNHLTPLVYVPCGNTVFWEHSCASGTAALGMYLAAKNGTAISAELNEPGGILKVKSDPIRGKTVLFGSVRMIGEYSIF